MAVDERDRKRMHDALERTLGPEEAATVMEHLPPVGWADVATKRDLEGLAAATKRDIEGLAAATKKDIEALAAATKKDIEALAAANQKEHEAIVANNQKEHEALKGELRAEIHSVARSQLITFFTVNAFIVAALNGGLYVALRLT